jgi:hypothetical protein
VIDHDRPDIADPGDRARRRKIIGDSRNGKPGGGTAELLTGIEGASSWPVRMILLLEG